MLQLHAYAEGTRRLLKASSVGSCAEFKANGTTDKLNMDIRHLYHGVIDVAFLLLD